MHVPVGARLLRLALAGLLAASVAAPAAGAASHGVPGRGTAASDDPAAAATAEPPLRNLPTSLLVTLRPGAGLEAIDAAAAERGLVRVAWSPELRTAQYVALAAGEGTATDRDDGRPSADGRRRRRRPARERPVPTRPRRQSATSASRWRPPTGWTVASAPASRAWARS